MPKKQYDTTLRELLKKRILLIDGAMGVSIQALNLTPEDFGGESYDGCNENLILTRPDTIQTIHEEFLEAGADIIETNTFGATAMVLDEYQLGHKMTEINARAVEIAKAACKKYATAEKPRFVAGAIGPTTKALSVTGGITFDALAKEFEGQALALIDAGADYLLLETALDTLNLKAAYIGILAAFDQLNQTCPVAVSGTIETMGTMLAGQAVDALYISCEHMNPLYIGLNCATGPEFMRDHIRTLSELSRFPTSCVPNAGIPDAEGNYPETPETLAKTVLDFCDQGWLNVIGGCCGTTPAHIKALSDGLSERSPRVPTTERKSMASGIEALYIEEDIPYLIGERSNVIGSRAFKTLITEEKFEEAAEIARKQSKAGAHIIDVCLSNPDRDETSDMVKFLEKAAKLVKLPLMIDSQVAEVIETAFKYTQGKCILNSVNLEDGERSFQTLLPIVKKYGAALIVGCIEDEMAVTAKEKLHVAERSHALLTEKYGIPEEDIIFDPLVFPCGTGDKNYFGSGKETLEGVRLIKERFPKCKTTLGVSNVSFGLPNAGREVLNSVFLYHATKAGLDSAIVNTQKLVRFSKITEEEKKLCDDLLWYNTDDGHDPIAAFAAFYRGKITEKEVVDRSKLSLEEKFDMNIVEGTKEFLIENLDEARKTLKPLKIINTYLMRSMDIVGRMFNDNELIVAEVLQSAEVMKTAVSYLEGFMEKSDVHVRGTMVLATVKGDVHDIGKNLVEIIMGNNGYKVIDLGIKCPPEKIIDACITHSPDLIGLSGLLVKSAQQMVLTAQDLKQRGIETPILVGGAALTDTFTYTKIASQYDGMAIYCKDAMTGLSVANDLMDPKKREALKNKIATFGEKETETKIVSPKRVYQKKLTFDYTLSTAKAPHFEPIVFEEPIEHIWPYINNQMLYGNHLGLKGNVKKMIAENHPKAMKLKKNLDAVKEKIIAQKLLTAKAHIQFFPARSDQNDIIIYDPTATKEIQRFSFPRQSDGLELCLSDYLPSDRIDSVAFFAVTCGEGVTELARELLDAGSYFESHSLYALSLESAEAFAEFTHQKIRALWGIPDAKELSTEDLFKLKYQGVRVSFGYPACPMLEDQEKMWDLMHPDQHIDIHLTDEYMMRPEASVSAMVFHHPQARYFSINDEDLAAFENS